MLVRNLPRAVTTTNEMNVILTSVYSKCTFRFNEKKKKIKAILLGWKENHVVFEGEKKKHDFLLLHDIFNRNTITPHFDYHNPIYLVTC